ncbi:MAG: zinc-ribbon domain-containing protein [Candidatus Bathyarchaeia archaeon]
MVYCTKCGTKNEEDAKYCSKCGANLEISWGKRLERQAEDWGEQFGKRVEEECFGLPQGGAIIGLVIGAIIVLLGLSWLAGENWWRYLWPLAIIFFGILIVAGALYSLSRKY